MKLIIKHPAHFLQERIYILKVIIEDYLGLQAVYEEAASNVVTISTDETTANCVEVTDVFFQIETENWLQKQSLPAFPLKKWDIRKEPFQNLMSSSTLPVIYGKELNDGKYVVEETNKITIGIDIFGSAFFMLTRYEELLSDEKDEHGRFPHTCSLNYHEKLIKRPIVDEYVEFLWWALSRMFPQLKRKDHTFSIMLSHDVDMPHATLGVPLVTVFKHIAGDVVKRKRFTLAYQRFLSLIHAKLGNYKKDMFYTFPYLMEMSEKYQFKSAFYFITDRTAGNIDGFYSLKDHYIKELLKTIASRGHEIGLHPSYGSFVSKEQIKAEADRLKEVMHSLSIDQELIGGRMHFLRWKNPETWSALASAGMTYDSTLGFANEVGFRSGTCREYPVFDLIHRKQLPITERPLLVMDQTLLNNKYMNLSIEEAYDVCMKIAKVCKKYQGNFTMLWHNSHLVYEKEKRLYEKILTSLHEGVIQ
jgi:peptidoglycan/xylan/chitin deacetylase (PgdA/CDA1 family)